MRAVVGTQNFPAFWIAPVIIVGGGDAVLRDRLRHAAGELILQPAGPGKREPLGGIELIESFGGNFVRAVLRRGGSGAAAGDVD